MPRDDFEAAILIADITGSTPLYEAVGNEAALVKIGECLDGLRSIISQEGGTYVYSKGDDVLCAFSAPSSALSAVRKMLSRQWAAPLAIHAGLHFGHVIHARGEIFGDAINLTARLAALAKPDEVLISRSFVEQLSNQETHALRLLDNMTFKGKSAPIEVYSLLEDADSPITRTTFARSPAGARTPHRQAVPEVTVTLRYGDRSEICREGASLSIGRSEDCDIVIPRNWVSRQHAAITVRRGKIQLVDQSLMGTHVAMPDGHEFFLRRETVVLTGSAILSPSLRPTEPEAEVVHCEVVRHRPSSGA